MHLKEGERIQAATAVQPNVPEPDDVHLVAECRSGNEAAWRRLYDAQFSFVFRTARRLGIPPDEAEDVAHDVFVIAHRRLSDFSEGRVSTWLYRITANVVSNRHRRRRVRERLNNFIPVWGNEESERPDRAAEMKSASAAVDRVLARMSPKKREVFALFELERLEGEEIAERVGCPVGTVWTRLHHARKEFVQIARKLNVLDEVSV